MRASRLLVAAAVLLGVVLVPGPAAAEPTDGGPVFVPATGAVVTTPFPTEAGNRYQVTVTGAYSYNGGTNLADCGWWNPEGEGDAWYRGGFLRLDGASAACLNQPYTATHTYTWVQSGTGAPFTFWIYDNGHADNAGGLTVEVVEVSAPYEVTGYCDLLRKDDSDAVLPQTYGVVVHARATGGGVSSGVPPLLGAVCEISGTGGSATVTTPTSYVVTAGADAVLLPPGEYTACLTIYVWYHAPITWGPQCRPA